MKSYDIDKEVIWVYNNIIDFSRETGFDKMSKKVAALFLLLALMLQLASCRNQRVKRQTTYVEYFDTVSVFTAYTSSADTFSEMCDIFESEIEKYHRLFDIYNTYDGICNLKTLNDSDGAPIPLGKEVTEFIDWCKEMYVLTDGYMNIALGSVLKLWHDCREEAQRSDGTARIPTSAELSEASEHTDITKVITDTESGTVILSDPLMSLDVGAVGKGYAAKRIHKALIDTGYTDFLINLGGNITVSGKRGDTSDWNVGIENPTQPQSALKTALLSDISLVSSGSYLRYFECDGVRYHHIINPYTLMPENTYLSVTVLDTDPARADALSTALFNMDTEDGTALIDELDGVEAMWILNDGTEIYSSNFRKYLKDG